MNFDNISRPSGSVTERRAAKYKKAMVALEAVIENNDENDENPCAVYDDCLKELIARHCQLLIRSPLKVDQDD